MGCEDERRAQGVAEPSGGKWKMSVFGGVFNIFEVLFSFGTCGKEMFPTINDIALFFAVVGGLSYYVWIGLLGSDLEFSWGIAWVFYIIFITILTLLRSATRDNSKIVGNIVEDFFACLFGYYNALPQMMEQPYVDAAKKDDDAPVKAAEVEKEIEDFAVE